MQPPSNDIFSATSTITVDCDLKMLQKRISFMNGPNIQISDNNPGVKFYGEHILSRRPVSVQLNSNKDSLVFELSEILALFETPMHGKKHLLAQQYESKQVKVLEESLAEIFQSTQKYCLVRIMFALPNYESQSNNFACLLPFVKGTDNQIKVALPWNGMWWEQMKLIRNPSTCPLPSPISEVQQTPDCAAQEKIALTSQPNNAVNFISIPESKTEVPAEMDVNWQVLAKTFIHREYMIKASLAMRPFLEEKNRRRHLKLFPKQRKIPEQIHAFHPGTYLRCAPFHIPITIAHECMKSCNWPASMCSRAFQVLESTGAFDLLQNLQADEARNRFQVDLFMSAVVATMSVLQGAYRSDYEGEDIGKNSALTPVDRMTASTPMIAGGDCEDKAQTFYGLVKSLMFYVEKYDTSGENPLKMSPEQIQRCKNVFGFPKNLKWEVYLARGTCMGQIDNTGREENHTFGAVLHRIPDNTRPSVQDAHLYRIHAVETTTSVVVVANEFTTEPQQSSLANFVSVDRAAVIYQNVVILDQFLVFEFRRVANETYKLQLGAQPFFDYHYRWKISSESSVSSMEDFTACCSDVQQRKKDEAILLLITTENFYFHYNTLCSLACPTNNITDVSKYLMDYHGMCKRIAQSFLFDLFQENEQQINRWMARYDQLHLKHDVSFSCKDILDVVLKVFVLPPALDLPKTSATTKVRLPEQVRQEIQQWLVLSDSVIKKYQFGLFWKNSTGKLPTSAAPQNLNQCVVACPMGQSCLYRQIHELLVKVPFIVQQNNAKLWTEIGQLYNNILPAEQTCQAKVEEIIQRLYQCLFQLHNETERLLV